MATPRQPSETLKLPPELRRKFVELERRLWLEETARASSVAVAGLALAWLAVFFSDRIWDTPVWLRLVCFLAGTAAVLGSAGWWFQHWGLRRRTIEDFAVLVQKRYRRLGDTLLGVVELADETRRPAHYSPALYEAAIRQVAVQAEPFDFRQAVPLRPVRLAASAGGGLLAVIILILVILPAAALNAFRRWVAPTAVIARHTLVELEGLMARQVVAHGEPFEITGTVRYRSFWKPSRGTARFARQLPITFSATDGLARFQVAGQVERGTLRVRVGDAVREVDIEPEYRPALHELAANIEYPAYLQYPPADEKIGNGILSAVEGSRVRLAGTANRSLAAATLSREGETNKPLSVTDRVFRSEGLLLPATGVIAFDWRDSLGLTNAAPWKLTVQSVKDAAPAAGFADLGREVAILESELLELKVSGRDDFGVKEVGVNWEVVADEAATNTTVKAEFKQAAATPREKKFEETFSFNPGLLNIPPDSTVEIRAYATDFLPGREPVESIGYRVHVLGNERHSEMVRQKLESLLARLEEVTRLEEKVAAATREALTLGKEKFEGNEGAERAAKLAQEQMQAARQLDQLAEEGVKTLREATRNPAFADEKLREWAKNMQAMQDISGAKMKEAAKALQSAKQPSSQREQKMGDALAKEEESLKALEELQKDVNEGLDDLQAMTLAQRLRKLGADQQAIRGELQHIVPEVIGLLPSEVPDRFRKAQDSLASQQSGAQKETEDLKGELGRFFERTRRETYGRVNQEMTKTRAPEELEKVRGQITENITMEAMQQLLAWSKRFEEWAEVLEPKENQSKESGDKSSSSAASQAQQMLNQLMALLRMREGQVNLRERTRLLEKQKAVDQGYEQRARMLASGEQKLMIGMHQVQQENPLAELGVLLEDTMGSMRKVENILSQPRTDQVAVQAHTKTVEQLTDVINLLNEQAKRNPSSSSAQSASAEEMAFLMQMMAQQQGQSSGMAASPNGGNNSGGGTGQAGQAATGDATGKGSEGRNVSRATGVTGGNVPTEFREALENYFNALEGPKK